MSHDTLFQLGMGSVLLNASQKEDTLVARTFRACAEAICMGTCNLRVAPAVCVVAVQFLAETKQRGNSAKARIPRQRPAITPSNS